MTIKYVTSNRKKFEEAAHIFSNSSFTLEHFPMELTEVQGESKEIITYKAKQALDIVQSPLIVEDVSFCCKAIGDLPGPYVKYFLKSLGEEGIYRLISNYQDHTAQAICIVAYIEPGSEPQLFEGIRKGKVVPPKGSTTHGNVSWNRIFQQDGFSCTYGELSMQEISKVSPRASALKQLIHFLEAKS